MGMKVDRINMTAVNMSSSDITTYVQRLSKAHLDNKVCFSLSLCFHIEET